MPEKNSNLPHSEAIQEVQDHFILEWGRMSSSWGINRTMAQIHALLIATGTPHTMDQIISRLGISRGNASMSLRDLMEWGVVKRSRNMGDRKDSYFCDADPVQTFARVVRERKRREIDPTKVAIKECLLRLPQSDESVDANEFRMRLRGLLDIFHMIDAVYEQVFQTDESIEETFRYFQKEKLLENPKPGANLSGK